ncbi:uroporphyrinogen III methyltransferase / synthase [Caldanaerobius fijiensis DSM 17918]|uniref:uroporphyrinogen-III C-methyltransferase n=1 Tax=Caldanaerobius fijiensis DSM 17918 TaxID=1121256 RepID=A0A1M4YN70_9THEO|nr:uroporphyrinogen-III C-methyltransferase [Caldanaerobius fijiensis]SHF06836.1 uroporphyrinogen III methyltransferase / synthase [Caldanaerobius fijiensis DSM 17918]
MGKVFLVGMGPGDPDLITKKAERVIKNADVLVYDRLINSEILSLAKAGAELIDVGKLPEHHKVPQDEINRILIEKAKNYEIVARLKGGDPFVFGRGGEEALFLHQHGIPFEVVPGVTSAVAVPAYAGIPVTHRDLSSSLHIITGHERAGKEKSALDFKALAALEGTLVFLMGIKNIEYITGELIKNGKSEDTPAAVISNGTMPDQVTVIGTLKDISQKVKESGISNPAVIVIGDVVRLRGKIDWYRPSNGKRILLTRTFEQSVELMDKLKDCGYQVISCPTIKVVPVYDAVGNFIASIDKYDYMVFSSVNSVKIFREAISLYGFDIRKLNGKKIAAVGKSTADRLKGINIYADIVPQEFTSDALAGMMKGEIFGKYIAVFTSDIGGEKLIEKLEQYGGYVDKIALYNNVPNYEVRSRLIEELKRGVDIVVFTSPSTFEYFAKIAGEYTSLINDVHIVAIGPVTRRAIEESGYRVDIVPESHDTEGIIDAINSYYGEK